MRSAAFLLCALFCGIGIVSAYVVLPDTPPKNLGKHHLLGSKECTWGPSYWCSNLTAAAGCRAVPHCIQTVWVHQNPPPDTDSVCQICVKMVTQARDQLESNETQEELKEVFEGSCNLIPLKTVSKECRKMVDEFVPELVETLASQMNPQVVCSVAGLCNNARIDALLEEEAKKKVPQVSDMEKTANTCDNCHTVVDIIEKKFNGATKSDVLYGFLEVCAHLGSFSDSCSNIVLTYFPDIYNHLKTNLNSEEVCLMSGECSAYFHIHAEVQPLSNSGFIPVSNSEENGDDLPCKLCEQLVGHLRDLLIANTTELEFQKVLEGLCSQMKGFKQECISIADEYYPIIYNFLVSELNSTAACSMIGICPNGVDQQRVPIVPLLLKTPSEAEATKLQNIMSDKKPKLSRVPLRKSETTVRISESTRPVNAPFEQLPIERLAPQTLTLMGNTELCTLCEYFLHYVQQAITQPATEEEIKREVFRACDVFPKTLNANCRDFVNTYGDAMVAILAQEIDPSQMCPMMSLCPSAGDHDVEVFIKEYGGSPRDKPNCPLCLFAVEELESLVKNNKTKQSVKAALGKLCSRLSANLAQECNDFVNTYADELIEMLMSDFEPQEVCVYLKLCNDTKIVSPMKEEDIIFDFGGEIATNEIPDNTINGKTLISAELIESPKVQQKPQCILCEFVMSQIENQLEDNKTDEAIKSAVLNVCKHLPKTVKKECSDFVNQHGEQVIQLLIATLDPSKVCGMMGLCGPSLKDLHLEVRGCAICEAAVTAMDKLLQNPNIEHKIEHLFQKSCRALPKEHRKQCQNLINTYGDAIFQELTRMSDPSTICNTIGVCVSSRHRRDTPLIGSEKCTWGPAHWCQSVEHATSCGTGALSFCQEKEWKGSFPPLGSVPGASLPGSDPCTWGPDYWCKTYENAKSCGEGALAHCKEIVWKGPSPPPVSQKPQKNE